MAYLWFLVICVIALCGCSTPAKSLDKYAHKNGYERQVMEGEHFEHVTYAHRGAVATGTLHVYLEGDGIPWWSRYVIARDPTPRYALALRLMALDSVDSFYIARPCYNGFAEQAPCNNTLWTSKRYSAEVVDSMVRVIKRYSQTHNYHDLVLIGHSGGGTLAMLLAERLPGTRAVVTVAANMDIDAWTALHGYTPLYGSLNPAQRGPLASEIWQLHLLGGNDDNVPPKIIYKAVQNQPNPHVINVKDYDHLCCWRDLWPQVLDAIERRNVMQLDI